VAGKDQGEGNRVNTGGGAYVEGGVHVGRGDFVGRDQIINQIEVIIERALTETEKARQAQAYEDEAVAQVVHLYARGLQRTVQRADEPAAGGRPYQGLHAYDLGDHDRFFGRSEAKATMRQKLRHDSLTVLQAESGAGKTSLIRAGLMPFLIADGHLPVWIRPYNVNPSRKLKQEFLSRVKDERLAASLRAKPLRDFLHRITAVLGGGSVLYVFVDQFEEFFAKLEKEDRDSFVEELHACLDDKGLRVHWVLSLRSEAFGDLAVFETPVHRPFANWFRLNRLSLSEATEAVTRPAESVGLSFADNLLKRMFKDLDAAGFFPPEIQIVCSALCDDSRPAGQTEITSGQYDRLGGKKGILEGYLDRVVDELPRNWRVPAGLLLMELVDAEQKRVQRTREELDEGLARHDIPATTIQEVLERLRDRYVISTVELGEAGEVMAYELVHDYLAGNVKLSLHDRKRKQAQELLDQGVRSFSRHRELLTENELSIINEFIGELTIGNEARLLIASSEQEVERQKEKERRRGITVRVLIGVAITTVLVMIAALLATYFAAQRASQAAADEEAAQSAAAGAQTRQAESETAAAEALATTTAILVAERTVQAELNAAQVSAASAATREAVAQQSLQRTYERSGIAPVDGQPGVLAFDGRRLWVTQPLSGTLQALDPATGHISLTVHLNGTLAALLFDGHRLWVANQDGNTVYAIDATTGHVTAEVQVGNRPVALAFDGARVWVANQDDGTVQAIDVATGTVQPPIEIGTFSNPPTLAVAGHTLMIGVNHALEAIALEQDRWIDAYRLGGIAVAMAGDETQVWALRRVGPDFYDLEQLGLSQLDLGEGVRVLQLDWRRAVNLPPGHEEPGGLLLAEDLLWISDAQSDVILAIDPETMAFSEPFPVGTDPGAMIHAAGSLWVANQGDLTVQRRSIPEHILFGPIDGYTEPAAPEPGQQTACSGQDGVITVDIMDPYGRADLSPVRNLGDWTCEGGRVWTIEGEWGELLVARDLTSGHVVQTIEVPEEIDAHGLAFAAGQLWLAAEVALDEGFLGVVLSIDPVSGDWGKDVMVRYFPAGLAYDGQYLWTVNTFDDTVQAIDPVSYTALPPVRLALQVGDGLAFDGQRIWAAAEQDNSAQYVLVRVGE
jgi:YVTN family beta-propeller protein